MLMLTDFFFYRGDDFQKDYANLAMLCATFPTVPVVALTATASKKDMRNKSITKFKKSFGGDWKSKLTKYFLQESVSKRR